MECRRVRRALPLLAGGDLPGDEAALREHLAGCPPCRKILAAHEALGRALRRAGEGSAPLSDAAFLAALRARIPAAARPAARVATVRLGRILAAAAAAAAFLLVLFVVADGPETPDGSTTPGGAPPTVVAPAAPPVAVPEPGLPVSFDLPGAAVLNGGNDLLSETRIVPDAKNAERGGGADFPLFEMTPVPDAEVCADF